MSGKSLQLEVTSSFRLVDGGKQVRGATGVAVAPPLFPHSCSAAVAKSNMGGSGNSVSPVSTNWVGYAQSF